MLAEKTIVGIMSGTSLDGVDLACVSFKEADDKIRYNLIAAETIPYDNEWKKQLKKLTGADALTYAYANTALGWHLGTLAKNFINKNKLKADFVASHGHTIFHQPHNGLTTQIGEGASVAAAAGLPVVCNFRTLDVALGGQGAPLVPVGDKYLFNEFDFCLNLGGIANISFDNLKGERIAFDICPVNMMLNELALQKDMEYDKDGILASTGNISQSLLDKLNALDFYKTPPPKSLGYEWFSDFFMPLVQSANISTEDKLRTVCEHIAVQISHIANDNTFKTSGARMLATGGGAFNKFLMGLLTKYSKAEIVIPDKDTINFKEAIVFALLGYLRWHNLPNALASVTGAQKDSSGGAIYLPG